MNYLHRTALHYNIEIKNSNFSQAQHTAARIQKTICFLCFEKLFELLPDVMFPHFSMHRSSYYCRYFVLPCCFFDFCGKYQRRQCKKSQYREYVDFISEVSTACGFLTEEDCLRIPSTKRVGYTFFLNFYSQIILSSI